MNRLLLPILALGLFFTSCSKDDDIVEEVKEPRSVEVDRFIYGGMSEIYLYKQDVNELSNGFFQTNAALNEFLRTFDSPEDLYEGIQSSQDRFSFMMDDYEALENRFMGISTTTGMDYSLGYIGNTDNLWGIVRFVMPGTSAESEGVKRGDVFTTVNGKPLTINNYQGLLGMANVTIDINRMEKTNNSYSITSTGETKTLSGIQYTANPVLIAKTIDVDGVKTGYLMYNSFRANFNEELNEAFGYFQAEGVQELILDLRYNGGGSVATATGLAGMITGQFTDEIFIREQWNSKYQNAWAPESYVVRFRDKITIDANTPQERDVALNSLNLGKVYVLTTGRSASASELVINSLRPYIDVIQIGGTTTGKFQASITLYDSPGMTNKKNINPNHKYAIQPLVMKSASVDGVTDYVDGLAPDYELFEDFSNYGELGNEEEPFLNAALNLIKGYAIDQDKSRKAKELAKDFPAFGEYGMDDPTYQRMYLESLPFPLERELE